MRSTATIALGVLLIGLSALAPAAYAQSISQAAQAEATVQVESAPAESTFYVENMTCALCPLTVKAAMSGVEGVQSVEVNFEERTAHVFFDPAATDTATIALASEQAGYPAAVRG